LAIKACKECGKDVSTTARSCPHCGAKRPRQVGFFGILLALFFGWLVYSCTGTKHQAEIAEQAKTPAEVTAESKEKSAARKRFAAAMVAEEKIKKVVLDPTSVRFRQLRVSADAAIICAEFVASNGFGGASSEQLIWVNGNPYRGAEAWIENCKSATFDHLFAVH